MPALISIFYYCFADKNNMNRRRGYFANALQTLRQCYRCLLCSSGRRHSYAGMALFHQGLRRHFCVAHMKLRYRLLLARSNARLADSRHADLAYWPRSMSSTFLAADLIATLQVRANKQWALSIWSEICDKNAGAIYYHEEMAARAKSTSMSDYNIYHCIYLYLLFSIADIGNALTSRGWWNITMIST